MEKNFSHVVVTSPKITRKPFENHITSIVQYKCKKKCPKVHIPGRRCFSSGRPFPVDTRLNVSTKNIEFIKNILCNAALTKALLQPFDLTYNTRKIIA